MGVERPILGLMSFTIVFTVIVGSMVFLSTYAYNIQENFIEAPLTIGHAQCYSTLPESNVFSNVTKIFVANVHRADLRLVKAWVGTEAGPIEVEINSNGTGFVNIGGSKILVLAQGFHKGNMLLQGQHGIVRVLIDSESPLHVKGKIYLITLYFKVEGRNAFTTQEARVKPGETPRCD